MTQETVPPPTPAQPAAAAGRGMALALATVGFAVNFWAWSLLSPLAPPLPGAARPEPAGRLGDGGRAGDRRVARPDPPGRPHRPLRRPDRLRPPFVRGHRPGAVSCPRHPPPPSPALLLGGLVLGLGGASFAVGVPFVSAWFPPERRGFALGVYGMGNIGTAISGFASPRIADGLGREWAFLIVAAALALTGLAFLALGREA